MAALLPSLSSDDEEPTLTAAADYSDEESDDGVEVNEGFVFGGALVSFGVQVVWPSQKRYVWTPRKGNDAVCDMMSDILSSVVLQNGSCACTALFARVRMEAFHQTHR